MPPSRNSILGPRRGAALLLVLAVLALLTITILALFLSVTSEVRTSKLYATDSSVKLLSQTAVNLVEGEVYQATSQTNLCWASQPGMIRTYDTTGTSTAYYKLYSDSSMTGTGTFDHTVAGLVPDGTGTTTAWYSQKGVYIDLNQPLSVGGVNQYPIVDGDLNNPSTSSTGNDLFTYNYPQGPGGAASLPTLMTPTPSSGTVTVYGPALPSGAPQVAGFWVNSNASKVIDPRSPNQVPMPVKWLYVLKDGSIAVPDSDTGGTTVSFSNSAAKPTGPSGTFTGNPIVGRIAFWTDDETCKVNINTASEGSYNTTSAPYATSFNDTPRVCTPYDLNLEKCPAEQNEFQRYPGHPSTVSLSTVFGNLTTNSTFPENIYSTASTTNIAPRTIGGGSYEATNIAVATNTNYLQPLNNRLYATADELMLQPYTAAATSPPARPLSSATIDQQALKRAQFFITANSRAPDVNLFNLPRVCIWPISANQPAVTYQTAFDQLIAFCTTFDNQPYYFQRADWTSQSEYNTPARNQTLLNYLQAECGLPIPGFGTSTFVSKYSAANTAGGTELNQILMEIFDYIRSTNIYDSSLPKGNQYNPSFANLTATKTYGAGEVVPSWNSANDTQGFGRYPIISKAGILFIASGTGSITSTNTPANPQVIGGTVNQSSPYAVTYTYGPTIPTTASPPGKVRVQAALLFSLFVPGQGYTALIPDCNIEVVKSTLTWNTSATGTQTTSNTSSPMFPNAVGFPYPTGGTSSPAIAWGGNLGIAPLMNAYFRTSFYSLVPTPSTMTSTALSPFPDFTAGSSIMFTGTVEVQVLTQAVGNAINPTLTTPPTVVQDVTFDFGNGGSGCTVTVPTYVSSASPPGPPAFSNTSNGGIYTIEQFSNFNSPSTDITGRMSYNGNHSNLNYPWLANFIVSSKDALQGIQCTSGDLRLVAGHHTIPPADPYYTSGPALFGPNPLYGTTQFAHNFEDGYGMPWYGATRGQLVAGISTTAGTPSYWSSAAASCPLTSQFNVAVPTSSTGNPPGHGSNDLWFLSQTANTLSQPIQTSEPEGFGSNTKAAAQGVTSGTFTSWVAGTGKPPPGDFDNGAGAVCDGPYINKADEGGLIVGGAYTAYYMDSGTSFSATGTSYFSPAREMPSAVMFGSLPTGVIGNKPWQTLLFHPDPTGQHAGAQAPMDHLLLDLFTMPVVEPYAISEPLSTAGRINMNYLIVPFTYINRDTGVRAVMESQQMLAVPNTDSGSNSTSNSTTYKQMTSGHTAVTFANAPAPTTLRYSINLDETMKGFINRFYPKAITSGSSVTPDIFHSPSEICTLPLVPNDTSSNPTYSNIESTASTGYWPTHLLTGDNSLERPYANIYPLLTTKSNTFTVHFRVQALQPLPNEPLTYYASWHEGSDVMTSEYRGSQTIERYIDPASVSDDYAAEFAAGTPPTHSLPSLYRFRVVSTKQFNP